MKKFVEIFIAVGIGIAVFWRLRRGEPVRFTIDIRDGEPHAY